MHDQPLQMNDIKEEENVFYHPEGISYEHQPHYYREAYYQDGVNFDDDDDFFNENVINYNGHDFRFIQD